MQGLPWMQDFVLRMCLCFATYWQGNSVPQSLPFLRNRCRLHLCRRHCLYPSRLPESRVFTTPAYPAQSASDKKSSSGIWIVIILLAVLVQQQAGFSSVVLHQPTKNDAGCNRAG